ncbi:hypothetical protein OG562_34965 [Streptomyces sp. NBC_01275]|uniref:hypothetical protein n=1 Tax=Streptomyces sp. NBC_01275 TaxID=2903807 RepID=UPI0022582EC6|nr:hypothetical protein [Streptomyces sp. NBC_01275]MCX4766087.1 hypothetical protein [Streptomyces sp. NBC_01275]
MPDIRYEQPYHWWGLRTTEPEPLSVLELVDAGTFDTESIALLWFLLQKPASILVSALPHEAGKTTTLTALLDFLPARAKKYYLRGSDEDFSFATAEAMDPHDTYLLVNEFSGSWPPYMWGSQITRLFALLPQGYLLAGSIHCDSVEEVIETLSSAPNHAQGAGIRSIDIVVILHHENNSTNKVHRCASINLMLPGVGSQDIRVRELVSWDPQADRFIHHHNDNGVFAEMSQWCGIAPSAVGGDLAVRQAFLEKLQSSGVTDYFQVREAIAHFTDRPSKTRP